MKKSTLIFIGVVAGAIVLVAIAVFIRFNFTNGGDRVPAASMTGADLKHISYTIDGEFLPFDHGTFAREVAPGSASKEVFATFGEPAIGDLDGDGDQDAVTYLMRSSGGSGTFFYVVSAVNDGGVFKGTNAIFLGDRIAPQNINIIEGNAVANFAERNAGEPFSVQPSVGKSVWIHLDAQTHEIGEMVKNFEGEADPARMTLDMKTWNWVQTEFADGTKVLPKTPDVFSVEFGKNNVLSVKTDCNTMGGEYATKENVLTLSKLMSTRMFCEGSQEGEFYSTLSDVEAYHFTGKGELYLELKGKGGSIVLR